MWARMSDGWGEVWGKYHWYENSGGVGKKTYEPKCNSADRLWFGGYTRTKRKQPRVADRCKRCIAALRKAERREHADAE